jgi:hypothetical protein
VVDELIEAQTAMITATFNIDIKQRKRRPKGMKGGSARELGWSRSVFSYGSFVSGAK